MVRISGFQPDGPGSIPGWRISRISSMVEHLLVAGVIFVQFKGMALDTLSEWLLSLITNQVGSALVGSNPSGVGTGYWCSDNTLRLGRSVPGLIPGYPPKKQLIKL